MLVLPSDRTARIRSLQTHHTTVDRVEAGNRVAVNLTGIAHTEIRRGDTIVHEGDWHITSMIDAHLEVLASLSHEVSRRGAYAAYIGSGEFPAKVRVLGPNTLAPGEVGRVRLYLDRALPALPGDRFILRESGRDETIGGGHFLDVDPQLPASKAKPDLDVNRVIAERGWVEADHLERLTGQRVEASVDRWVVDPSVLEAARDEVKARIADAGSLGLDVASLDDHLRAVARSLDDVEIDAGRATIGTPVDPLAGHPWIAELEAQPFAPPNADGVDRSEVRELVRRGLVIEHDKVYFAASAVADAAQLLANALAEAPEGLTVSEIRDVLGTSRKYVLAMLAHFDRSGMTRRRDDYRIAGPRLPEPSA